MTTNNGSTDLEGAVRVQTASMNPDNIQIIDGRTPNSYAEIGARRGEEMFRRIIPGMSHRVFFTVDEYTAMCQEVGFEFRVPGEAETDEAGEFLFRGVELDNPTIMDILAAREQVGDSAPELMVENPPPRPMRRRPTITMPPPPAPQQFSNVQLQIAMMRQQMAMMDQNLNQLEALLAQGAPNDY